MARSNTKQHEPGKIGSRPEWSLKRFFTGSGRPPHSKRHQDTPSQKLIKTTPESQLDDDALPIANQFATLRQTQDFSINGPSHPSMTGKATQYSPLWMDTHPAPTSNNGTQQHRNAAPACVLQAQGPDLIPEHPISDSHAPLSSSPKPMYQHQFLTDDEMFMTAEVGDTEVLSSPDEPEDGRDSFPELPGEGVRVEGSGMSTVSQVPDPVEAPASPMMQNSTQSRVQDPAELSSWPRPSHSNVTQRTDAVAQLVPGHTGTAQNEANAASTMAGQAARVAVKRNAVLVDNQIERHDGGSTPQVDSVPVDSGNFQNSLSPNESNGGTRQKEQRPHRTFALFTPKRDSQDDKPKQLQKPDPQTLNFDGFSDQKRVDVFLKDYNVPRNRRLDPLSTLLEWVELKLKESEQKHQEFNQQATSLDGHKRDIAKLRAELLSMQGVQGTLAKTQQKNQQQLENAHTTIDSLRVDLHKTRQAFATIQGSLEAAVFERDQERDQAESRIATMSQDHRETIERMGAESKEKDARHEISMMELQQKHDDAMDTQKRALQDLRRHMANYSNTGSYTAISDDEIRGHFQLLTRRINNLIKWVPRPETYAVSEHLDPNGFLTRNSQQGGRNWPKFVRSICWRSIMRGFYCRQLGFGAFGNDGEGFEALDHLRQLFALPDCQGNGLCGTLPNTKELNTWRAGFFDALVKATQHGAIGQADNKYVRLFRTNVEAVTGDLVSSLQQVAQIRLDPGIWEEVAGFVEGLGTLALEMGSQRAHVYLETCEYGEDIAVGDRFRDDAELGFERLRVDLMTQPCLRRVGDGREDLTTQRTIVKGDFVALKPGVLY
ncbi:hypothetical protein EDB80DRAFT_834460 [Ilyonectria destructans]|nr:hypothetical protein EDB80DRAFT_834460 [Ilyonectria destructans]